jgi:hypothetical protein
MWAAASMVAAVAFTAVVAEVTAAVVAAIVEIFF